MIPNCRFNSRFYLIFLFLHQEFLGYYLNTFFHLYSINFMLHMIIIELFVNKMDHLN
jgi:hypothetical protein